MKAIETAPIRTERRDGASSAAVRITRPTRRCPRGLRRVVTPATGANGQSATTALSTSTLAADLAGPTAARTPATAASTT